LQVFRRFPHRVTAPTWIPTAAPGGGIVTLDASIAGIGAVTAEFVRNFLVLEVSVVGTGLISADMARQVAIEALIAGTAIVTTPYLSISAALAAVIAGQAVVLADITVTGGAAPVGLTSVYVNIVPVLAP
jgi:hypothetical protein